MKRILLTLAGLAFGGVLSAAERVETPRPVPATRPEMKRLLEDMKSRPIRIPLPELTAEDREQLGERADSYEARLRYHYLPAGEGSSYGGGRRPQGNREGRNASGPGAGPRDFTRNSDENMSLSYSFKTMLFWIVSRTNNCQYCLGHQEQKLAAAGLSEDMIAALDFDWSRYTPAEQAAFAYARKLTYEPNRLTDGDIDGLRRFYTDPQILEMTMSVAGNNAINRWKEGAGIPQSSSGINFFRQNSNNGAVGENLPIQTFETPTSAEFEHSISKVAALAVDPQTGEATGAGVSDRPALETPAAVEAALAAAGSRKPRLPLQSEEATRSAFGDLVPEGSAPDWLRLLANFPNDARNRVRGLVALTDDSGDLSPLLKARVSWVIARQDRAWYATGLVQQRLRELGQSDDDINALDREDAVLSAADRAMLQFSRHLAATPVALTDQDVAEALRLTSPREVVQLVNFITSRAYFDRVTEAAGLTAPRP